MLEEPPQHVASKGARADNESLAAFINCYYYCIEHLYYAFKPFSVGIILFINISFSDLLPALEVKDGALSPFL